MEVLIDVVQEITQQPPTEQNKKLNKKEKKLCEFDRKCARIECNKATRCICVRVDGWPRR